MGATPRLNKKQSNKDILNKRMIKQDWENQIKQVDKRANEIAKKSSISPEEVKKAWIKTAKKIINREYRKKRFNNRNSMGKCPAKTVEDRRCKLNVPKKSKAEIRRLQFEIELRQMNIKRESEKLTEEEVCELMNRLNFKNCPTAEIRKFNQKAIKDFFTDKNGDRYVPPAKNESRGKKDILKDIAYGEQKGRAGFCINHLRKKLELIKTKKTKDKEWSGLHEERILTLKEDAPPSIRQKVEKTIGLVKKMLEKNNISISAPPVEHIGIETARFDISYLAQAEGKKTKNKIKNYQAPREGDKFSLIEDQGGLCLFCGELLHNDSHIDHLFPKSKGGGNTILNKVVGHSVCNINKNNKNQPLDQRILESIKKKKPKKYNFIKNKLVSDNKLPQDMLAAPQHTMFGAKLLKGAFIEKFKVDESVIKRIRSKDVDYLRKFWFKYMHLQKKTLRYKDYKIKLETENTESNIKYEDLKPYKSFSGNLSSVKPKGKNWLKIDNENKKVEYDPNQIDVGFHTFVVRDENDEKIILSLKDLNKETEKDKDKKMEGKLNKEITISLKEIFSKDEDKIRLLKDSDTVIELNFRYPDKGWLRVKENKDLIGTPKVIWDTNNISRYVPWCDIKITNETLNKEEKIKLKTQIAEKTLTIAVQPAKDDSINDFHHALDAIVLAANVDWDSIQRLNENIRERDYLERKRMSKEASEENAPKFNEFKKDQKGNLIAPEKSYKWYFRDKEDQRKLEFSKTDTEPLRSVLESSKKEKGEVLQRHLLEKIKKKNIKNIKSKKIREGMKKEWEEIEKMNVEEKKGYISGSGKDKTISNSYFLKLSKDNILYPKNTRSALCKVGGTKGDRAVMAKKR